MKVYKFWDRLYFLDFMQFQMNAKFLTIVIGISAIISTAGIIAAFSVRGTAFGHGGGSGSLGGGGGGSC